MRIAAIASAYQIRLAPHLWGGALMFAAGLHLCAAAPAAFILNILWGLIQCYLNSRQRHQSVRTVMLKYRIDPVWESLLTTTLWNITL